VSECLRMAHSAMLPRMFRKSVCVTGTGGSCRPSLHTLDQTWRGPVRMHNQAHKLPSLPNLKQRGGDCMQHFIGGTLQFVDVCNTVTGVTVPNRTT